MEGGFMEVGGMEGGEHDGNIFMKGGRSLSIQSLSLPSSPYYSFPCPLLLPPCSSSSAYRGAHTIRIIEVSQLELEYWYVKRLSRFSFTLVHEIKLPGPKPTMRHRQMEGKRNHWRL